MTEIVLGLIDEGNSREGRGGVQLQWKETLSGKIHFLTSVYIWILHTKPPRAFSISIFAFS